MRWQSESAVIAGQLRGLYDRDRLIRIGMERDVCDRSYMYSEVVKEACGELLRSCGEEMMWHDGELWRPLDRAVLKEALRLSLVREDDAVSMRMGDWMKMSPGLVSLACDAVGMSRMEGGGRVVAFTNGVWDFTDIDRPVKVGYSERPYVTERLGYAYDEDATCEGWLAFLRQVLNVRQIRVLQKYLSLGLVDRRSLGAKVEQSLWLIGSGANGKSVIFETMRNVYGGTCISEVALDGLLKGSLEERGRFVAMMEGKTFNWCSEITAYDMTRSADAFKSLCSGEPQAVRQLGKSPRIMYDVPYLIFNMNRRPVNKSIDHAVQRRLIFIDFERTIRKEDMNVHLADDLRGECPGIRNWLMQGYRMLREDGFKFSDTRENDEAHRQYMLENEQTVKLYMDEHGLNAGPSVVVAGGEEQYPQYVKASDLYNDYARWCADNGYVRDTQATFGRQLGAHRFAKQRKDGGAFFYVVYSDRRFPLAYMR